MILNYTFSFQALKTRSPSTMNIKEWTFCYQSWMRLMKAIRSHWGMLDNSATHYIQRKSIKFSFRSFYFLCSSFPAIVVKTTLPQRKHHQLYHITSLWIQFMELISSIFFNFHVISSNLSYILLHLVDYSLLLRNHSWRNRRRRKKMCWIKLWQRHGCDCKMNSMWLSFK